MDDNSSYVLISKKFLQTINKFNDENYFVLQMLLQLARLGPKSLLLHLTIITVIQIRVQK